MTDLSTFQINGTTLFHSAADTASECLSQAHALLTLTASAHEVCDGISSTEADALDNLRDGIKARAFSGIATLIALAQSQIDADEERRWRTGAIGEWNTVRATYDAEDRRMQQNEATPYRGTIDDPECAIAEAKTAEIVGAYDKAADALLRFPAPNKEALRFKLAVLATSHFATMQHNDAADYAKQVRADADALLAGA